MLKLLNRFAWFIAIIIGIIPIIIDEDYFIVGIIILIIVKFGFLSENFIKERLEFFANSIKENYLSKEKTSSILNSSSDQKREEHNKIKDKKIEENIVNLEEIKEQERINEIKKAKEKRAYEKLQEEINQEKIADMKNNQNYTQTKYEPNAFDLFLDRTGFYIKDFFSTNLLAKLGGILVFLAVVYFLKGVVGNFWEIIGPIGRITLGIIIGFITYLIGIKIYSNYENEGIILMGTGILINFAVILSGRYLIGDNGYLTEGTTFLFLILNTVFAVLTSLIYKSKTLLLFSFIFAYINPFIIGAESNGQPYTLIMYSFIVSIGALLISRRQANITIVIFSFIAGNLLFLLAPFSDSIGWSSKIILTSIYSLISIITINKFKGLNLVTNKGLLHAFIGSYVFIILNLLNSSTYFEGNYINVLSDTFSFIVYNLIILSLFIFSIKIIKSAGQQSDFNPLNFILFLPLILLVGILYSGNLIFTPFILTATIITYLIGFTFIQNLSNIFSYIFFGTLAVFILIFNLDIVLLGGKSGINSTEFITIVFTSLIFLFSSYYYSIKENLSNLFTIGTIGTILILSPVIRNDGEFMNYSILAISIFALANWILLFVNKNLIEESKNLSNLIIGSVLGALFLSFQIFNFGEVHFPGITEGFVFLSLAIIYFIQGYLIANKLGVEKIKKSNDLKNVFYSYVGISISLFSVAVAFVFSNHPEIITTTWLFEATILYFFYSKSENLKIFWAATILFIIGLTKFGILIDIVNAKEYIFFISFSVILTSFILNLFFINKVENKKSLSTKGFSTLENNGIHNFHNILHLIGMGIMGLLLIKIIPSTGHGWNILGISIFITILGSFYAKFNLDLLKKAFIVLITIVGILHIGEISQIFGKLNRDELEYLKIIQYIVSAIIIANIFIWNKLNTPHLRSPLKNSNNYNKILLIIISIYSFIISNIFIIDLFENIFGDFTLTIYWGLIAASLLIYGIQRDIIKYRTIGLYFLALTSAKIFLYDVWQIGDTNSRVAVFAILGVIFIIISTLYTKRFGDNLLGEFSLDNLKDNNNSPIIPFHKEDEKNIKNVDKKEKFIINEEIKDIDVSNIKSVKFLFSSGKIISIRAVNLIKITKLIIRELDGKTKFEKGDLSDIYEYVKNNYKSELSKSNYDKIITIIEKFVLLGGEVIFIEK